MRPRFARLFTFALIITAGCGGAQQSGFGEAERLGSQLVTNYFPPASFATFSGSDLVPSLAAFQLSTMDEAPLSIEGIDYAVRVLVMTDGVWGDEVVSIVQRGDAITGTYKHFRKGSKDGFLTRIGAQRIDKPITISKLAELKGLIDDRKFMEFGNEPDVLVNDGPMWVLEVYDGHRYHAAFAPAAFSEPIVADVARLAIEIADVMLLHGGR